MRRGLSYIAWYTPWVQSLVGSLLASWAWQCAYRTYRDCALDGDKLEALSLFGLGTTVLIATAIWSMKWALQKWPFELAPVLTGQPA